MAHDFLGSLGHLALGSRLKRAGTLLQSATQAWLREAGCDVPAGHMPLLAALESMEPASLGTLVESLGIAQPGVSRMAGNLEAAGWITSASEAGDKRVRLFVLTPEGRRLVAQAKEMWWPVIQEAAADLCADLAGAFTDQLAGLEEKLSAGKFEEALGAKSQQRIRKHDPA